MIARRKARRRASFVAARPIVCANSHRSSLQRFANLPLKPHRCTLHNDVFRMNWIFKHSEVAGGWVWMVTAENGELAFNSQSAFPTVQHAQDDAEQYGFGLPDSEAD